VTLGAAPTRLHAALERAREQHPYAASGTITDSHRTAADAAALWTRLSPLAGRALDDAVRSLGGLEVRLLVFTARARLAQPECRRALAAVLAAHHPANADRIAWEAFLLEDGSRTFAPFAAPFAAGQPSRERWLRLLDSPIPSELAATWYLDQRAGLEAWAASPEIGLARHPEFLRLVQRRLLGPDRIVATSRKEGSATIDQWAATEIPAGERKAWYRGYLEATYRPRWAVGNDVLATIIERFGEPSAERPFWTTVPAHVLDAVRLWLKDVQLTRLLGEGERVEFWRRFLVQMVRSVATQDGEAVLLVFDNWFAVQFVRWGHATYMFPSSMLRGFRYHRGNELYKLVLARKGSRLGRYEHRGYDWQSGAEYMVRAVMARADGG
jgi:hypothetical protein